MATAPVRTEIENLICRLANVDISEAGQRLLQGLRATDPDLAADLEAAWNSALFDAIQAGFACGLRCSRNPELLIFREGS